MAMNEETRKGPWTEQEDMQLVCYVGLFGERRWDFIAKVSGLNRTGKSCRLRWVNYLHPGLKRGRMTPQEERLVLELHSRWGNRWSRIARKLPGRTDNEIKNYWRTHMRKKAQERKKNSSPSSSSSSLTNLSTNSNTEPLPSDVCTKKCEFESSSTSNYSSSITTVFDGAKGYPMDQIWKEIATSDSNDHHHDNCCNNMAACPLIPSPVWEFSSESLWRMVDEEQLKMPAHHIASDYFLVPSCHHGADPYG